MANNVAVTAGSGTVFKTTDNAGVHTSHQNLNVGGAPVSASNPLPITARAIINVLPTMGTQTNGAYAADDFVDGKLTLANAVPVSGTGGRLGSVRVYSKSTQTGQYDVAFFNADPTATTITNNGVQQVNAADLTKLIGWAHCNDVTSHGTGSCHTSVDPGLTFKLAGTSMWAAVVCRFALTQTSTSDMILSVDIIPD